MKVTDSIWRANSTNVEQYRKYDAKSVINDVTNEFKGYSSFDGVHKGIIVGRIMNSIRQSLRVRGVNVLFRLRRTLVNYEKQLTNEIRVLQTTLNIDKAAYRSVAADINNPNVSRERIIRYVRNREAYLITKVKLKSKILERKQLRLHLKINVDDILKENK